MKNALRAGLGTVTALVMGCFILGTTASPARSVFVFGGNYSRFSQPGASQSSMPRYRDYPAALTRPSLPAVPASTATDYLPSVCGEGEYTWEIGKMPIKVWIADGTGIPGYKSVFQTYIRNAFDTWSAASDGKLAWKEVADANQADVTVRWTDRVTERPEGTEAGRTSALTRLNTVTHKGIVYGARMLFLTRLPERGFSDEEVEKTTLHEAGHCFGLQGHSPYRSDIMYYAVGPGNQPALTSRDRNTLLKLYADAPTMDEAVALGKKAPSADAAQIAR